MIICHCVQFTEENMRKAIRSGALIEDLKREYMVMCTCSLCADDIRRLFLEEGIRYDNDWNLIPE